jgi:formylglycine-generating enzyme required for sulfatase activity
MTRQANPYLLALLSLLTLGMVMLLPVLNQDQPRPAAANDKVAEVLPQQRALQLGQTAMVLVDGDIFTRGTTVQEVLRAVSQCVERDGGRCDPSLGADSYPAHVVRLNAFWMEINEVTYGQYVSFLNTLGTDAHLTGCDGQPCVLTQTQSAASYIVFDGTRYVTTNAAIDDYPVVDVTWYGAQAYCEAIGRRLPTEAEWEFAARGPRSTLYPWGNTWVFEAANVRGSTNRDGTIIAGPQPVGGQVAYASRDGIRDLAGNVAEWVADWYHADFYATPASRVDNPLGPQSGDERVVRGGSWDELPFFARSVQRGAMLPTDTSQRVGFRCAADG